jgi:hypothetical protein
LVERRDGCNDVPQQRDPSPRATVYLPTVRAAGHEDESDPDQGSSPSDRLNDYAATTRTFTYCFLRLAILDSAVFDCRYELRLRWAFR